MSSPVELQEEEREVLLSIYDGDPAFKQLSSTVYQYMYGEHDKIKSFLLEIQWTENYPNEKPVVNMDTFYNRNIIPSVKRKVVEMLSKEADQLSGEAMTYSLFECLKEKFDEVISEQPEQELVETIEKITITEDKAIEPKKQKKEQLTKAQKRRQWDRVEARGERPRGWDWVDIVKHLSQTGTKEEPTSAT